MKEMWKQVPDWPLYEASTEGRVRRIGRLKPLTVGKTNRRRLKDGKHQGEFEARDYDMLCLSRGDGTRSSITVHRVILETFVGKRPPGFQCRHLNDDPQDNRLENLSWGTPRQNYMDRLRNKKKKAA